MRERRRSLSGGGACASGGVGKLACDDVGGVIGSWATATGGAGWVRRDWRERHVEKMLPMAVCVESWGGLAGGEANSADWRRVKGGVCDESHGRADGSSIVAAVGVVVVDLFGDLIVGGMVGAEYYRVWSQSAGRQRYMTREGFAGWLAG